MVLGRSSQVEEGGYAFGGFDRSRQHRRLHCTNNENEIPPELRDKGTTEQGRVRIPCIAPTSSIQEGIRIRIRRFRVPLCKGGGWEGGMDRRYSCGIGAGGALPGAARLVGKTEKASSRERCSKTLRETKDQKILRRGIDRELAGSDKS